MMIITQAFLLLLTAGQLLTSALLLIERHKRRRMHDRVVHLQRKVSSLERVCVELQQSIAQNTSRMELLKLPSARRSHAAHISALQQNAFEQSMKRRTIDLGVLPTQEL